jgi:hypothetical protein
LKCFALNLTLPRARLLMLLLPLVPPIGLLMQEKADMLHEWARGF